MFFAHPLAAGVAGHEPEVDHGQQAVDGRETDQRRHDVAGADVRHGLGGLEQPVDDPRLAAHLGEDPAGRVGYEGERYGEDRDSQEPGRLLQPPSAHEPEARGQQDEHEDPATHHYAEGPVGDPQDGLVVARSVLGGFPGLDLVDALHRTVPVVVGQHREHVG